MVEFRFGADWMAILQGNGGEGYVGLFDEDVRDVCCYCSGKRKKKKKNRVRLITLRVYLSSVNLQEKEGCADHSYSPTCASP